MVAKDPAIQIKAIELGKLAVRATTAAGSGHPTTALSLAHIVAVLMYKVMRWDPRHPAAPGADRLVLSEGHAVPIVYAACADLGVAITPNGRERKMTIDDLTTLRAVDSILDGHPNPALGFPFFDAATGSLGQGLSVAAGLAAAARIDGLDKTVFCIIGDGESREGQNWEAMDFIAEHALTNVVAIFNCNTLGQSDFVAEAQDWKVLKRKAEAFGWTAFDVDGHDPAALEDVLRRHRELGLGKPLCLLARTVKGWGISDLEGTGHHGTPVPHEKLAAALASLDAQMPCSDAAGAALNAGSIIAPPPGAASPRRSEPASFVKAVAGNEKVAAALAKTHTMSPRRAFGLALEALGHANPAVTSLDADVKNSTYADAFAKAFPDRYFEARIAEQNMISVAAGLSSGGKIPFASTFGRFLERAFDQIEMAIIGGANLKLVGSHVGVTLASDGPSQMALADVSFMRGFAHVIDVRGNPALTVLTPCDGASTYSLVIAMAAFPSACYLRAVRADLPTVYGEDEVFPFGGHKILHRPGAGQDPDVVLVSCGYLVHSCLEAAKTLTISGVCVAVVDAYCLPMQTDFVLALALGGAILTVEDTHIGGIGSELAEAAAANGEIRVEMLAVRRMPKRGRKPDEVLAYVGLAVDNIVSAAMRLALAKKTERSASNKPHGFPAISNRDSWTDEPG